MGGTPGPPYTDVYYSELPTIKITFVGVGEFFSLYMSNRRCVRHSVVTDA